MDVNYKKAFEWYEKATEQGNAMAQSNMGVMYDFGLSVDENHKKTVEWYEIAAEQGSVDAQFIWVSCTTMAIAWTRSIPW